MSFKKANSGFRASDRYELPAGARELYARPQYYDKAYRERHVDVDYYVTELSETRGPVLELGAGTGRVTLALARAGLSVVAVDTSAAMLDQLQARLRAEAPAVRRRVTCVCADMRQVALGKRFRWVIAPFNTVLHLYTNDDVARFLAVVRQHLRPRSGVFLFDYATPRVADLAVDPERWFKGPRLREPESGKLVRYAERFHYSPQRQVLSTWLRFEPVDGSPAWEVLLTHRQFFPLEMQGLLQRHGFGQQRWSADFTAEAPRAHCDVLVGHCKLAGAARETAGPVGSI